MPPPNERIARRLRSLAAVVVLAGASSVAARPDLTEAPDEIHGAPHGATAAGTAAEGTAAEGTAAEVPTVEVPAEGTAAEVTGAPRPGHESGRVDRGERDSLMRRIGRGVLFVPRAVFDLAFTPVRGGVWVVDRYHLAERARRLFFTDDEMIGLYPTARLESGAGVTVGARFVAKRNDDQRARIDVAAGGRYRQIVSGRLYGSYLEDRLSVELRIDHDLRPRERFFGIGNGDEVSATTLAPGTMIDARVDDTAVATRFRQRLERAAAVLDVRAVDQFHVRAAGTYAYLTLSPSDTGPPISDVYLMDSLVGFNGVQHVYGELELAWDSRGPAPRLWDSGSLPSTGWLVSAFAGRAGVARHPDHWRYGGDIQRFIRLDTGPRVLALRLHGEAVTGSRGEVPLFDLPALGGSSVLRGYPVERFRDRVAAFGSAEYQWDLAHSVFGSLFVDAGRVFPAIDQIGFDELRCGYGVALEVHGKESFLVRASLASSIDGGVFVDLSFDPIFDVSPRVVRR
jgi:hypothetical protein